MLVARTRRHEPSRPKPVHKTSSSPYALPLRREAVAQCHLGRVQGNRLGSFGKDRVDLHGRAAELGVAPRVDGAVGGEHGEGLCRARHLQRGQAGSERPSGQARTQGSKDARTQARKQASAQARSVRRAVSLCCKLGVVLATCVTPPAAMIASLVLSGRSPPAIGSPHASTPPASPAPAPSLAAKAYLVAYTASTPAAPSKALTPAVGCSSSPPEMASPQTVSAPSACSAAKAAPVLAMLIAGLPSRPVSFSAWWGLG